MATESPENIEELLHRRTDLSTFLVHFTRQLPPPGEAPTPRNNLISMLHARTIEARSAYGLLQGRATTNPDLSKTQQCVCFTETPLEHAWMMCKNINLRAIQFAPYGLAFTKTWARRAGVNPVWYVDQTPGHDWLTPHLNELADLAEAGHAYRPSPQGGVTQVSLQDSQIARLAPFIEQMGTYNVMKEFWWEREWRKVGDLPFGHPDVVAAFAPEDEHEVVMHELIQLEKGMGYATDFLPNLIDPRWGLERMIAKLAQVPKDNIGPFPGA